MQGGSAGSCSLEGAYGSWGTLGWALKAGEQVGAALGDRLLKRRARASFVGNDSSRFGTIPAARANQVAPGTFLYLPQHLFPPSAHGEAEEDVRRRRSGNDIRAFPIWEVRAPSLPSTRFRAFGADFACVLVATEPQVGPLYSLYR